MEAGNGQPAPPARRVRVGWYPSRCVPASASVISPPPRGEGASGTPGLILSGEWRELGFTGNVRKAAATASRLYWSRPEFPTPPPTDQREGADRPPPVTRHAERRKLREARSLRAFLGQLFAKFVNPEIVWVCGEKQRVPVHIWCLADLKKNAPDRERRTSRGESCADWVDTNMFFF